MSSNSETGELHISNFIVSELCVFLKSISIVIKTGMNIIGVNTPEKM